MADQDELRKLTDADGVPLPDALREHGVELDSALDARRQLEHAAAYLELHIEQGPVLESLDLPLGAVLGTFGVERHRIIWRGQAAHAGSTPMDQRRDALAGAAKLTNRVRKAFLLDQRPTVADPEVPVLAGLRDGLLHHAVSVGGLARDPQDLCQGRPVPGNPRFLRDQLRVDLDGPIIAGLRVGLRQGAQGRAAAGQIQAFEEKPVTNVSTR
jgi:hypothetical protein